MVTTVQHPASAKKNLGIFYVAAFVVMANANAVFSGNLLQSLHLVPFLFWGFLAASLFFMMQLAITQGVHALAIGKSSFLTLFTVNTTGAFNWFCYFYALKFIEPAVATAILVGIGPLATIGLERVIRWRKLPPYSYFGAAGILFGTALLAWASLSGFSGLREIHISHALIGLLAATIGGVAQAMNVVAVKRLGDKGWSASQIMAHRFYLLILAAMVLGLTGPGLSVEGESQIVRLAIATFLGIVIPLWMLQRGILYSEPFTVVALLSLGPVLTYAFQGFDGRIAWSTTSALGCSIVAVFTCYILWIKSKQDKAGESR